MGYGGRGGAGRGVGRGAPGTRVYVGNLSWETTWQSLKDHFRQAGEVVHADVMMHDGRSKGCGIVAFQSPAEAANAIATLSETELDGRHIFVREDREDPVGGLPAPGTRQVAAVPRYGGGGLPAPRAAPVDKMITGTRVYVGNLSWETTWQSLKDHFRQAGEVVHADVMMHDGRSKGCGIVAFQTPAEAANAIATLTETELDGRYIFVREDREDSVGGLPAPGTRTNHVTSYGVGLPPPRTAVPRAMAPISAPVHSGNETRVYVGNLSWQTSWQTLKDHFRQAGEVLHADVMMQDGRSKGCGIVSFATPAEAANAIATLSETELDGRQIFVREDREAAASQHSTAGGRAGGRYNGATPTPTTGCQVRRLTSPKDCLLRAEGLCRALVAT